MRKYFVILLLLIGAILLLPTVVNAADIHVCDTAVCGQTPGNGSTWSVALDDLPTNLTRGNTYYIADGNYNYHRFNDTESGETYITIKKATADAHGSDTGWDNAFGDGQAIWGTEIVASYELGIRFRKGFYIFDGVVGSGSDPSTYGFAVVPSNTSKHQYLMGIPIIGDASYQVDNVTVSHTALVTSGEGTGVYGQFPVYMNGNSSEPSFNITVSNNYIANGSTNLLIRDENNLIIRDNYFYANWSSPDNHGQQISSANTDYVKCYNNTFIDSVIFVLGSHNELGGDNQWDFYNNIIKGGSGAVVAAESGQLDCITNSRFHHNTFVDTTCPGENCIDTGKQTDVDTTKSYAYNNLFYNVIAARIGQYCGPVETRTPGCVVHDNNSFLNSTEYAATLAGEASGESDDNATSAIFTNYATGDYSIAAANQVAIDHIIGQGKTLASPFDIDRAGVTRTAPFDIGAYDVGGEADTTAPILAEVTPVSTPSSNQAPSYVFSSDEAGTVTYGGTCGNGSLSTAIVGNNTTQWNLAVGTYSNCTITVTDAALNASTPLAVTEFVITPVDSAAAKTIEGGVVFTTLP